MNPFGVFALVLPLLAAPPAPTPPPARRLIEGVPYLRQERFFCGPACLGMVFGYYGIVIPQERLAGELYRKELSGSLNLDLLVSARRHGFAAAMHQGTPELLKDYLDRDVPVITLVRVSSDPDRFHYLVVFGYDDQTRTFTVHSGGLRAGEIGYREFDRDWEAADRWMLTVERKKEL
ncbi:MAG: C39 family peptidase [Candidatus Erginobacter occultus]|nr:C39 family peptidase [Candidatus Erginobacter occultus]